MADGAQANIAKYKSGFGGVKRNVIKAPRFKIVDGYTPEQLNQLGLKRQTYPTPKKSQ